SNLARLMLEIMDLTAILSHFNHFLPPPGNERTKGSQDCWVFHGILEWGARGRLPIQGHGARSHDRRIKIERHDSPPTHLLAPVWAFPAKSSILAGTEGMFLLTTHPAERKPGVPSPLRRPPVQSESSRRERRAAAPRHHD